MTVASAIFRYQAESCLRMETMQYPYPFATVEDAMRREIRTGPDGFRVDSVKGGVLETALVDARISKQIFPVHKVRRREIAVSVWVAMHRAPYEPVCSSSSVGLVVQ